MEFPRLPGGWLALPTAVAGLLIGAGEARPAAHHLPGSRHAGRSDRPGDLHRRRYFEQHNFNLTLDGGVITRSGDDPFTSPAIADLLHAHERVWYW